MLGGASRLTAIREQGTLVSSRRDRGELAVPAELPRGLPTVTRAVTKPMLVVHGEGLAVWVVLGSLGFGVRLSGCTLLAGSVAARSWLWQSITFVVGECSH